MPRRPRQSRQSRQSARRRRAAGIAAAAVAVVVAAVALPLFQPWRLVTDTVVDESLPGAVPISTSSSSTTPPTVSAASARPQPPTPQPPTPQPPSPQPPSAAASRPAPHQPTGPTGPTGPTKPTGPVVLLTGTLISHEHRTSGSVAVLRLPDGSRVLRIENLDTSDGPDLKVWLSDAKVVPGKAGWHVFDDGRYRNLGDLKGNHGNQNYPIPADVRLEDFPSAVIWCDRFNVSFGAATLA